MHSLHAMDMRVFFAGLSLAVLVGGCSTTAETATTAPAGEPATSTTATITTATTTTTTIVTTTSTSPTTTSGVGRVPTEEELYGIWWLPDKHLFRWNADGSYAVDDDGRLVAINPDDTGTFVLSGSTLMMESGPTSALCTEGDPWTVEVQLLDDSILFGRDTEVGCAGFPLVEMVLFRVSPGVGVECDDEMVVPDDARPFGPETGTFLRPGTWLVDCGPRLVHVSPGGTYVIDDQGRLATGPADSGAFEQNDGTLTFTSGEDSEGCEAGSMLVIEGSVAFEATIGDPDQPGPIGELERPAFHGNVIDDGCSRMSGPTTWIQLSP